MTSNVHLVLFTKEDCGPCLKTKEALNEILESEPKFGECISVMKKENHSALVEAYGLNLYPTLLIVGPNGIEVQERIVGGKKIREVLDLYLTGTWNANATWSEHE